MKCVCVWEKERQRECVCETVRDAEIEWCHNAGILRSFWKSAANYSRWNEKKQGTRPGSMYDAERGSRTKKQRGRNAQWLPERNMQECMRMEKWWKETHEKRERGSVRTKAHNIQQIRNCTRLLFGVEGSFCHVSMQHLEFPIISTTYLVNFDITFGA